MSADIQSTRHSYRDPAITRAAIESLEERRLMAVIGIDREWGEEGLAVSYTGEPSFDFSARQLVNVDRKGNVLTVRWKTNQSRLQRYLPNGQSDPTFLRPLTEGTRSGVARVDNLDRIVVAGNVAVKPDQFVVVLTRYLRDGQLDKSFAGDGNLGVTLPATVDGQTVDKPSAVDLAIDSQRRAWVLLRVRATGLSESMAAKNQFYVLVRYAENGALDTTFGNQGRLLLNLGSVGARSGGEIRLIKRDSAYVMMTGGQNIEVIGLDANGRRQKNYADNGRLRIPAAVRDKVELPNSGLDGIAATVDTAGRLYVGLDAPRNSSNDRVGFASIARIAPSGSLDASFGTAGIRVLQSGNPSGVRPGVPLTDLYRLQIDDAGRVYGIGAGGFARLTSAGQLDTVFDEDGLVSVGAGGDTTDLNGLLPGRDPADPEAFYAVSYFNRIRKYRSEATGLDADGQLNVIADPTSRKVDIRARADGRVRVQVGTGVSYFPAKAIKSVLVHLTDGDDVFTAYVGAPIRVFAGDGNDSLHAIGSTEYNTGAGNDTVIAGDGKDTVNNGDGNDIISLGAGSGKVTTIVNTKVTTSTIDLTATPKAGQEVSVDLGFGNDLVHISGGGRGTVRDVGGTLNRIYVESTPTSPAWVSTESAQGGRFFISTRAGNDTIIGGKGRDQIMSGAGNDLIHKLGGFGYISAAEGDDSVRGGAGNDSIFGGYGNDTLRGSGGDDRIDGGPGDDRIFGNEGADRLYGGDGTDSAVTDEDDVVSLIESISAA